MYSGNRLGGRAGMMLTLAFGLVGPVWGCPYPANIDINPKVLCVGGESVVNFTTYNIGAPYEITAVEVKTVLTPSAGAEFSDDGMKVTWNDPCIYSVTITVKIISTDGQNPPVTNQAGVTNTVIVFEGVELDIADTADEGDDFVCVNCDVNVKGRLIGPTGASATVTFSVNPSAKATVEPASLEIIVGTDYDLTLTGLQASDAVNDTDLIAKIGTCECAAENFTVLKMEIKRSIDGGPYESITDINRNILPGQGMSLKMDIGDVTASNYSWTVPGVTFKDYLPSDEVGVLVANSVADFSAQTVHFYWADACENQIKCQFMINGQSFQTNAMLNVKKPICGMRVVTLGTVCVTNYPQGTNIYTLFGLLGCPPVTLMSQGIMLEGQVQMPSGFEAGQWFFSQVVIPGRWREDETGENREKLEWNGISCLDHSYIWGDTQSTGMNTFDRTDNPRITIAFNGIVDWVKRTVNESFKTYIMFRPPGTDFKDVPLKYVSWSWCGVVTWGTSGWELVGNGQSASQPTETTVHPTWSHPVSSTYVPDI